MSLWDVTRWFTVAYDAYGHPSPSRQYETNIVDLDIPHVITINSSYPFVTDTEDRTIYIYELIDPTAKRYTLERKFAFLSILNEVLDNSKANWLKFAHMSRHYYSDRFVATYTLPPMLAIGFGSEEPTYYGNAGGWVDKQEGWNRDSEIKSEWWRLRPHFDTFFVAYHFDEHIRKIETRYLINWENFVKYNYIACATASYAERETGGNTYTIMHIKSLEVHDQKVAIALDKYVQNRYRQQRKR